jgi:hypothetical protein
VRISKGLETDPPWRKVEHIRLPSPARFTSRVDALDDTLAAKPGTVGALAHRKAGWMVYDVEGKGLDCNLKKGAAGD